MSTTIRFFAPQSFASMRISISSDSTVTHWNVSAGFQHKFGKLIELKYMALITIFLFITTGLFLMSKLGMDLSIYSNWQLVSQYISLIGTVLLSLSFVLGSRAKILDKIFGGLDRVIKMHHIIGGIAFVLLLHHPLFLTCQFHPKKYFPPSAGTDTGLYRISPHLRQ